jgi:hypothetical protein
MNAANIKTIPATTTAVSVGMTAPILRFKKVKGSGGFGFDVDQSAICIDGTEPARWR